MPQKGTIHHIEINVSALNHSRKFWEWLLLFLGYTKFQEWDAGFSFKSNDTYIVFVQAEKKYLKYPYNRKLTGLNHIAFCVDNREEVDKITDLLKENGVTILYPDKHPFAGGNGHYAVYFEDPDRIKVEIVAGE